MTYTRSKKPILRQGKKVNNILVIGDLHEPFCLDSYLKFNVNLYNKYNCDEVVFIGDIIDGHAWNYHEHNPDGKSPGDELIWSIKRLERWYEAFPKATILLGNHDLLISRKAKTAGLSQRFIRNFGEIIDAPTGWDFKLDYIKNNVLYTHGSTGNAIKRARESRISTVQGHLHSVSFVEYSVSIKDKIFGMNVGCGIDRTAYVFEYGKALPKKPVIGSGLVLDNGNLPIIELVRL